MNRFLCFLLIFCALHGTSQQPYCRFTLDSLIQRLGKSQSLDVIEETTLRCKLRRGMLADVSPYDRVCYIVKGPQSGEFVFVPHDEKISIGGTVFEWYSLGRMKSMDGPTENPPAKKMFTLPDVEKVRDPKGNIWNAFIRRTSIILGLYMLPKITGGDSALTHKWDEVNLVTRGAGKFQVGNDIMDVKAGDIIYVRKGNPHWFHSLDSDLDILIFFEMKSME